ncbi:hypothetical protein GJ744_003337 [Endocarpon pusillum]|uniref:Uncharacterized protein n=1 Tax=Endocarpon pusillum TaxID=364733 RepID=A0A8H7DZF4_9EURO|nr:hypothetical protein GJ744_003337 [Endocarpon pusillum]
MIPRSPGEALLGLPMEAKRGGGGLLSLDSDLEGGSMGITALLRHSICENSEQILERTAKTY